MKADRDQIVVLSVDFRLDEIRSCLQLWSLLLTGQKLELTCVFWVATVVSVPNSPLVLFLPGVEKDFVNEILENHISFGSSIAQNPVCEVLI